MKYAIIAAGEGSRLAKEGFTLPKPMVNLHGEMLIERLIRIFTANNAEEIMIIINEASPLLEMYLMNLRPEFPVRIVRKSTPSSLHSAYELFSSADALEEVCLTTTDTVFLEEEFEKYIHTFAANKETDALMAVTSFVDDESPLFVKTDQDNNISAFLDEHEEGVSYVSGGIYCLRRKAIGEVTIAVENGTSRMRNFQRQLVEKGLKVNAHLFSKIVDVDHVTDIKTAEIFLSEESVA